MPSNSKASSASLGIRPLPPLLPSSSSSSLERPAAGQAAPSGSTIRLAPELVPMLYDMIARVQKDDSLADQDDDQADQDDGRTAPTKSYIPIARIKTLMKRDGDVAMLSSDAPQVMSKASALFIADLTYQAWKIAHAGDRRVIKKEDVMLAIRMNTGLDFLYDIIVDPHRPSPGH